MIPDVLKGIPIALAMILVTAAIGFAVGWACQGPEEYYDEAVDPPEESDFGAELPEELVPAGALLKDA